MSKYTKKFELAVSETLKHEGGYSFHPNDPGGETNMGICKRNYPLEDIKNLTKERAIELYWQDYWRPLCLDMISDEFVAAEIFDTCVNMGPFWAVKLAQQACNLLLRSHETKLAEDGVIGPKTIGKLNELSVRYGVHLVVALNLTQGMRYAFLKEGNPDQYEDFIKGWMLRLVPRLERRNG